MLQIILITLGDIKQEMRQEIKQEVKTEDKMEINDDKEIKAESNLEEYFENPISDIQHRMRHEMKQEIKENVIVKPEETHTQALLQNYLLSKHKNITYQSLPNHPYLFFLSFFILILDVVLRLQ